ncbi:unnamed protein product [Ectocarpus sp. 13 AM-2016]
MQASPSELATQQTTGAYPTNTGAEPWRLCPPSPLHHNNSSSSRPAPPLPSTFVPRKPAIPRESAQAHAPPRTIASDATPPPRDRITGFTKFFFDTAKAAAAAAAAVTIMNGCKDGGRQLGPCRISASTRSIAVLAAAHAPEQVVPTLPITLPGPHELAHITITSSSSNRASSIITIIITSSSGSKGSNGAL